MRRPRVKSRERAFYHCISRVVDGRFIFGTEVGGTQEAEHFMRLMRALEAFSGVRVLTDALMSNHFHLLCEVPEQREVSDTELLERISAGYGQRRFARLKEQMAQLEKLADGRDWIRHLLDSYRKRMFDISIFVKELKGGFAQSYNRRHNRFGVLWAERFKSVLLQGGEAVTAVAAYIDLNPVRAGLCTDPKDYRQSGYGEALGKGSSVAREGIRTILAQSETMSWTEVCQQYRVYLFLKGSLQTADKPSAIDPATALHVITQQHGELSLPERLRCRIRYFTEGLILGNRSFVESHIKELQQSLGFKRQRSPTPLNILGSDTLFAFCKLRAGPAG
jgi:putative transposase